MKLSKTTIARLRAVAAAITAHAELYNQGSVENINEPAVDPNEANSCATESCGTPACLFGWAIKLFSPRSKASGTDAIRRAGARALGLSCFRCGSDEGPKFSPAGRLFYPQAWPENFNRALHAAGYNSFDSDAAGNFAQACVAVARIEHFIRTNGAE